MTSQLLLGTGAANACTTGGTAAPSMLLHCYSQSLPLKHVPRRTRLKSNAAQTVSQGPSLDGRALTTCKQMQAEAQRMLAAVLAQLGAGEGQVEAAGPDGAQSPSGLCHVPYLGALALDCQLQGKQRCERQ